MKKYALVFAGLIMLAMEVSAATFLTIGVDLSGSNPLLQHKNFAHIASEHTRAEINKLSDGDVVIIKAFGAANDPRNVLSDRFTISRKLRTEKVADSVASYITSLPQKAESQNATNLIAWLEFTHFNCESGNGRVLAITDGLESSSLVSGQKMLNGEQGLPKPDASLSGCHVTFYGLGAGWAPKAKRFVRNEWRNWFKPTGATFTAIIP